MTHIHRLSKEISKETKNEIEEFLKFSKRDSMNKLKGMKRQSLIDVGSENETHIFASQDYKLKIIHFFLNIFEICKCK